MTVTVTAFSAKIRDGRLEFGFETGTTFGNLDGAGRLDLRA